MTPKGNIQAIANLFWEKLSKDQRPLNPFLTDTDWDADKLDADNFYSRPSIKSVVSHVKVNHHRRHHRPPQRGVAHAAHLVAHVFRKPQTFFVPD